jgi:hypothetical protein
MSVYPPLVTTEAAVLMTLMATPVPVTLGSPAPSVKQVRPGVGHQRRQSKLHECCMRSYNVSFYYY